MKEEFFKEIAGIFNKDVSELTDETSYIEELNASSGDYFAVIAAIEEITDVKKQSANAYSNV